MAAGWHAHRLPRPHEAQGSANAAEKTAHALFHGSGALLVGPATPGYPKPPGSERLTEIPGECQKPGLAHGRH